MGKVVTREWRKAKSAKLEFAFVSAFRDNSSFVLNILGPLCLWQCLADISETVRLLKKTKCIFFYFGWVKITQLQNAKMLFSQKSPS